MGVKGYYFESLIFDFLYFTVVNFKSLALFHKIASKGVGINVSSIDDDLARYKFENIAEIHGSWSLKKQDRFFA